MPTEIVLIQGKTGMSNQWWILGEANEAGAPLKIPHIVSFCFIFFFRDHHDLGEKWRNMRSNRSEDLFFIFFRDHHDFGKNKGNTRSKPLFF